MPSSLMLNTPPSAIAKRQRSRESSDRQPQPDATGQSETNATTNVTQQRTGTGVRIPSYLNKTKADISTAFQELEWQQRYRLSQALNNPNSPFRLDRSPIVVGRNRYANVQPWDAARIKLKNPLDGSDYVNASPIVLRSRGTAPKSKNKLNLFSKNGAQATRDNSLNEDKYIATQGPKDGQFSHFWHMVMQETTGSVGVIVMLTTCYEGGREKCAQYFPEDMDSPVVKLQAHDTTVEVPKTEAPNDGDPFLDSDSSSADTDSNGTGTDHENENASTMSANQQRKPTTGTVELLSLAKDSSIGCDVRRMKLTIGDTSKTIYHYLYNDWADFGRPEVEDQLRLLQLTRSSRKMASESPRIVHCSAGVGRTGTWIALDFLLRELEEGRFVDTSYFNTRPPELNSSNTTWGNSGPQKVGTPEAKEHDLIFETVSSLREQRMMMVMNELQYSFLYDVLKEAFMDKYAEKETGPMIREEPSSKVRRTSQILDEQEQSPRTTHVQVEDDGAVSEAETEIMDHEKTGTESKAVSGDNTDPYAAVAPAVIREGIDKKVEDESTQ